MTTKRWKEELKSWKNRKIKSSNIYKEYTKMKIKNVEIQNNGRSLQIETTHKGDYKFIFLDADNLVDIAEFSEHL